MLAAVLGLQEKILKLDLSGTGIHRSVWSQSWRNRVGSRRSEASRGGLEEL